MLTLLCTLVVCMKIGEIPYTLFVLADQVSVLGAAQG